MQHYRVNKLAKAAGVVVKTKDVLAPNDKQALQDARADPDCPVCDVYRAGEKVGSVS